MQEHKLTCRTYSLSYFVLAFWASTNYFARLQHLRLSPTPLSVFFQASILVWALSEVSFSIVYQFWAIRARSASNAARPD